jgi:hypothetical protein
MRKFRISVKHDNGMIKFRTTATDPEAAKLQIVAAEGCPESAIYRIEEVYTLNDHEAYLNDLYSDMYDGRWNSVKEKFCYMAATKSTIWKAYINRQLGTLLRRKDPIAFRTSYTETKPKQ